MLEKLLALGLVVLLLLGVGAVLGPEALPDKAEEAAPLLPEGPTAEPAPDEQGGPGFLGILGGQGEDGDDDEDEDDDEEPRPKGKGRAKRDRD